MTAVLENNATTFTGFSYEPVDVSQVPTRLPRKHPGRPSVPNPHENVMRQLAGSGEAIMFRLVHPEGQAWSDTEVKRLTGRQARLLRAAARTNDRSARVWHEVTGPEIRVYVQDKPFAGKRKKDDDENADLAVSQPLEDSYAG